MEQTEKTLGRKRMTRGIIIYALLLLFLFAVINVEAVNEWLESVLRLLRPILIGLALAYLCNPFFRLYERRLLINLRPQGVRRAIALLLTYLTVFLILALVVLLILPQLTQSLADFANNYNYHVTSGIAQFNKLVDNVNDLIERFSEKKDFFAHLNEANIRKTVIEWFGTSGTKLLNSLSKLELKPITEWIEGAFSVVTDTLFGFFISLYMLSSKEKRYAQVMKVRRALFGNAINQRITEFCRITDRSFGGFIEGKLLDSLIIGCLTFVTISIFRIPYAILIATFVGITNIVPVIGPIIGAIPTSFILLLTDPAKVIPFLIIIVIIQQLDGNVIGPKILGDNTGVSPLCVVIAIALMGKLWGLIGMILGVPLFAAVLELTDRIVIERLQKKGLPSGLENYYAGNSAVDPVKDAYSATDKTVQKLERRAIQIQRKQQNGKDLTRRERSLMRFYRFAHKYRIVGELSDSAQARFATEDAIWDAERRANHLADLHRASDNTEEN